MGTQTQRYVSKENSDSESSADVTGSRVLMFPYFGAESVNSPFFLHNTYFIVYQFLVSGPYRGGRTNIVGSVMMLKASRVPDNISPA